MTSRGRKSAVVLFVAASVFGLAGCSGSGVTEADAYKIGCPAVDSVIAGGSVGTKASVAGLEKLRKQPDLSARTTKWLDAAIGALKTTDPAKMPADARSVLVDGCKKNGYPLRNLSGT